MSHFLFPDSTNRYASYTNKGLLTSWVDERNNESILTYDEDGLLIKDLNAAGGFLSLSKTFEDNFETPIVEATTALGRSTVFKTSGRISYLQTREITRPNGTIEQSVINNNGTTTKTYPNGVVTETIERPDPRFGMQSPIIARRTIDMPSGLSFRQDTNRVITLLNEDDPISLGSMTDSINVNGRWFTNSFDVTSLSNLFITPEGRQQSTLVDSQGRVAESTTGNLLTTQFFYDYRGRLTGTQQGIRNTSIGYDAFGYVSSVTDTLGRSVYFTNDSMGRVLEQTLPDNRVISYDYDDAGNLTSITPPGRSAHIFHYNAVNDQETYTPPDIGIGNTNTHYVYNLDKELTEIRRPDGAVVGFGYNTKGQLQAINTPRGVTTLGYSPQTGQLTAIETPENNVLQKGYDGSLLTSETWSGEVTGVVEHGYDNNFFINELVVNNDAVSYQYDRDGLLTQAGDLSVVNDPINGFVSQMIIGSANTSRNHNAYGELEFDTTTVGGSTLYNVQYTRDDLGRIIRKVELVEGNSLTTNYEYDLAGRLWRVREGNNLIAEYSYDSNGNRDGGFNLSGNINASYDGQDRLASYNGTTYNYNANGDLVSKTAAGATTHFDYDVFGNLVAVSMPGGVDIEYVIDGSNRRIGKKVNGALVQGFLYQDQLNPVAELDGNGNVVARFVYADKANVPTYMVKDGQTFRIVSDHLGSPRLVTNTATGQVAQRMDYDEFGNVLVDTNPGFQPFGFAGGIYDQHTGLTRFGARDYDAEIGRWDSKDPIGFLGGDSNLFGYVLQNPINFVDPAGRSAGPPVLYHTPGAFIGWIGEVGHWGIIHRLIPYYAKFNGYLAVGATTYQIAKAGNEYICDNCFGTLGTKFYDLWNNDSEVGPLFYAVGLPQFPNLGDFQTSEGSIQSTTVGECL